MKPSDPDHEELLNRSLDGELTSEEEGRLEALLEEDHQLGKELASLRGLQDSIRTHIPAEIEPPHPDFFNSQIRREIEREAVQEERSRESTRTHGSWFALPWAVAAAAVAVAAFLGFNRPGAGPVVADAGSFVSSTYTPMEGVTAEASYSEDAEATVIRLTGLDELPAERKVAGYSASSYQPDLLANHVRDSDGGLLFVMVGNATSGAPTFFTR